MYNLALAYELVGDNERAIKFYKKALDVEPEHKEAKHNLELILGEPYSPNEAIEYIEEIQDDILDKDEISPIIEAQEIPQEATYNPSSNNILVIDDIGVVTYQLKILLRNLSTSKKIFYDSFLNR